VPAHAPLAGGAGKRDCLKDSRDPRPVFTGIEHVKMPTENGAESMDGVNGASAASASGSIPRLAEHLFRHEAGKLVSVLTGIFGLEHLHLAEDVVQDALIRALKTWPFYGVPKNPAAWLTQTAKNLALDVLRREKRFSEKQTDVAAWMEQTAGSVDEQPPVSRPRSRIHVSD
jgi:hypothetical protein